MNFSTVLNFLFAVFLVLGGLDYLRGNKWGLGSRFLDAFSNFPALALSMVGFICLAPVLGQGIAVLVGPLFQRLGMDPSVISSMLLALDMGGYQLAHLLAADPAIADFSGILLGSTMGPLLCFTIPVTLGRIPKEDIPFFSTGILSGIAVVPVTCLLGGLLIGLPVSTLLWNLLPVCLFALITIVGLLRIPNIILRIFSRLGNLLVKVSVIALITAMFQSLTGLTILPGMAPISEGFSIVCTIIVTAAGAFPLLTAVTRKISEPLGRVGRLVGINESAASGLVSSLISVFTMYGLVEDMDDRGKVVNFAFMVNGAFVMGGQMAFTIGVAPHMLSTMMVSKVFGGLLSIPIALFFYRKTFQNNVS